MMEKFCEISGLKKDFSGISVLSNINFALQAGDQCVIQGASGSGKSTLLHLMAGLERPSAGDIKINGSSYRYLSNDELASFRNKHIGLVFQFHYLLTSMNCLDNLLLPATIGKVAKRPVKEFVSDLAQRLGVEHCLKKYPFKLSGGEQQRINIIRALSLSPKLLLCDEPTGNLDHINSLKVAGLLQELASELNFTMVIVTHDDKLAQRFSQRWTMTNGVIEQG